MAARLARPGAAVAALAAAVTLSACAGGQYLTKAEMRACLAEAGITGGYRETFELRGNRQIVRVHPGPTVTATQAATANACIERATAAPDGVAERSGGGLPLPTQYALMPGDAELWPQLTLAQQQRAMRFLDDGSTIRSSLRGD